LPGNGKTGELTSRGAAGDQDMRPERRLARAATGQQVADYIRELIFSGQLRARQRIGQDQIANDMGVSRLPVREALIALESDGLVSSEPHRGVYIIPLYQTDIEDHYAIYARIQGLAARQATPAITAGDLDELESLNAQIAAAADSQERRDLDWRFHSLINHVGGSRRLLSVLRQMGRSLPQHLYGVPPSMSARAVVQHAALIDALKAGDADAADEQCVVHTTSEGKYLAAMLLEQGVLTSRQAEGKAGAAEHGPVRNAASAAGP
jgi:DNA-binding GntR family transcriptional regulator